jgi:hypothetical protein
MPVPFPALATSLLVAALPLSAQTTARSESSIVHRTANGDSIVEIRNSAYELEGNLVLRKTVHSREVIGDKGMESEIQLAAWPLGMDLSRKPLYEVKATGTDARTRNGEVWIVEDETDPDVPSWAVYHLGSGRRLFQTEVQPLEFGISRADGALRYAGLEVPPDDAADIRLRAKNVVAVLSYAGGERVIREALITCDDPEKAALLRSYFDEERTLGVADRGGVRYLRVTFRGAFPSRADELSISIPLAKDDLDLAHGSLPPGLHLSAWTR